MLLALALAFSLAIGDSALAQTAEASIADAELHYAQRALGARGSSADPGQVQAAILGYRRALALDPESTAARVRLLRALFFRGTFCGEVGDTQRATFEEAKRLAEESMRRLEARASALHAASRLEALRRIPGAPGLAFWSAVAWGQWSLDHKLSAAWQGAAGKIRALSEIAIALDPGYEQGSPYLVMGRLHAEAPKLLFLTNWISRKKAIASLRQALACSPANPVAQYFLADALLEHEAKRRPEALRLLESCASQPARPEFLVEDRHYSDLARARLQLASAHD
jgi:tetratricopeptide (TPR) repeat protein